MANAVSDPIKHVIVLMLENRPFDQMLGGMKGATSELDGLEGIDPGLPKRSNYCEGISYFQEPGAAYLLNRDPHHEYEHVRMQLNYNNGGFVEDFALSYPASSQGDRKQIMRYHALGALPALHALARNFTVCDHWHASVPGPTWTNRFFVHSGTSLGRVAMPNGIIDANWHWYDQPTLYDRLNQKGISWRIYYGDIPQSLLLVHQLEPGNAAHYHRMAQFHQDAATETAFPQYAFIEPTYYAPGANDDHPPHDLRAGQRLIAEVYNAIRANETLWQSSLLLVLYDEHGGMYDHVVPPAGPPLAIPPDHHVEEFSFDRFGVRVPCILVSPWFGKGVLPVVFDHTSLLRYLICKWQLGPLGARAAVANSFASARLATPREDAPDTIPAAPPTPLIESNDAPPAVPARPTMSSNQSALIAMSQLLESCSDNGHADLASRSKRIVTGYDGQVDVGIERVEQFLAQQRAKANV
ncbi:MAG: phospholipase C [Candidatus Binataceae bacterium]